MLTSMSYYFNHSPLARPRPRRKKHMKTAITAGPSLSSERPSTLHQSPADLEDCLNARVTALQYEVTDGDEKLKGGTAWRQIFHEGDRVSAHSLRQLSEHRSEVAEDQPRITTDGLLVTRRPGLFHITGIGQCL